MIYQNGLILNGKTIVNEFRLSEVGTDGFIESWEVCREQLDKLNNSIDD